MTFKIKLVKDRHIYWRPMGRLQLPVKQRPFIFHTVYGSITDPVKYTSTENSWQQYTWEICSSLREFQVERKVQGEQKALLFVCCSPQSPTVCIRKPYLMCSQVLDIHLQNGKLSHKDALVCILSSQKCLLSQKEITFMTGRLHSSADSHSGANSFKVMNTEVEDILSEEALSAPCIQHGHQQPTETREGEWLRDRTSV